jgi:2-oxoglutarate ferredoxin oxidoreductase subunit beta
MSELNTSPSQNKIGLSKTDYAGSKSTLCTGCGHDSISANLMTAFYQQNIHPHNVMKLSGIGCSSKTPTYWLSQSFGFNSIHGRMAPVATGAKLIRPEMLALGVSGDGDTASIGLGGFLHLIRRNLPIVYIVANNGVYGLTKGQFSATADDEMKHKSGKKNPFHALDICTMAIDAGCGFVARSFSGDAKQLVALISAAFHHKGTSVIDIISPCITFANHDGSTMSYLAVKNKNHHLQELEFIVESPETKVDYEEGTTQNVQFNVGSSLLLRKIDSRFHDVKNADAAMLLLRESRFKGEILTGLFYANEEQKTLVEALNLPAKSLGDMNETELRPSEETLKMILEDFR